MALKDWKEIEYFGGERRWENKKANKSIIITKSYTYGSTNPNYRVLANSLTGGVRYKVAGELNGKSADSMSKATMIAKSYMRSH